MGTDRTVESYSGGGVSRRTFIRLAAIGTSSLPAVLAACSALASSSPTPAPGVAGPSIGAPATPSGGAASVLPSFIPLQGGPKPDYAAAGRVIPRWLGYLSQSTH